MVSILTQLQEEMSKYATTIHSSQVHRQNNEAKSLENVSNCCVNLEPVMNILDCCEASKSK